MIISFNQFLRISREGPKNILAANCPLEKLQLSRSSKQLFHGLFLGMVWDHFKNPIQSPNCPYMFLSDWNFTAVNFTYSTQKDGSQNLHKTAGFKTFKSFLVQTIRDK